MFLLAVDKFMSEMHLRLTYCYTKKCFLLTISSVNVTKSVVSCGIGQMY